MFWSWPSKTYITSFNCLNHNWNTTQLVTLNESFLSYSHFWELTALDFMKIHRLAKFISLALSVFYFLWPLKVKKYKAFQIFNCRLHEIFFQLCARNHLALRWHGERNWDFMTHTFGKLVNSLSKKSETYSLLRHLSLKGQFTWNQKYTFSLLSVELFISLDSIGVSCLVLEISAIEVSAFSLI